MAPTFQQSLLPAMQIRRMFPWFSRVRLQISLVDPVAFPNSSRLQHFLRALSTAVNEGSHIKSGLTTGGADVKKGSKMRPGATKNGRNLCALRWLNKINKNGTTDEFKLYFNGLSPAQQKQYQTEADDLISASSWNKASDSAVVDGALH